MKPVLLSLALVAILYIFGLQLQAEAQGPPLPPLPVTPSGLVVVPGLGEILNGTALPKTNRPIPPLFTDAATKLNVTSSPQQCKSYCKRRDVHTWSNDEWALYGQLWNEFNNRGWLAPFQRMHTLDCNGVDNICAFHFSKGFFPWHRFYITHLEQLLQKVDHEINPGRAYINGEFCLGYWDWGYQEPFSNNLGDSVYQYLFGPQAVGTIGNAVAGNNTNPVNIPDSPFKNLDINGNYTQRAPTLGTNQWNAAVISTCLSLADQEANGNASLGLRPCVETIPHTAIHTDVGGTLSNLLWSPGDPVFFNHHTNIDNLWWIWEQYTNTSYPSDWNDTIPQPYDQWSLDDAKDNQRLCYTYVPNGNVTSQSTYSESTGISNDYNSLDQPQKDAVNRIFTQGIPTPANKDQYLQMLGFHGITGQNALTIYQTHLDGIKLAQYKYSNVTNYYIDTYGTSTPSSPSTSSAPLQTKTPTSTPTYKSFPAGGAPPSWATPSQAPPQQVPPSPSKGSIQSTVVSQLNFLIGAVF